MFATGQIASKTTPILENVNSRYRPLGVIALSRRRSDALPGDQAGTHRKNRSRASRSLQGQISKLLKYRFFS
jgi:hypothetical protein